MRTAKRQIIAKKFKGLFRTGEWQHTPQIDQSFPIPVAENPETVLSVLNSGIPPTLDITSQENNNQSDDVASTGDILDKTNTITSPLLRTPLSPISGFGEDDINHGDSERTEKRYQAAVLQLKQALDLRPASWDDLSDVTENDDTSKLRKAIENRLTHTATDANAIWGKGKKLFEQIFAVFFPLTRNILLVAKEAQSV